MMGDGVETDPSGRFTRTDEMLGRGAYKYVYKAFDNENALEVAWNKLDVDRLSKLELSKVSKEVELLEKVNHKNIISFFGYWQNVNEGSGSTSMNFITELMMSGTLKEYIRKAKAIKLKVIRRWGCNILEAIEYLHTQNPPIIHRDLKCDNIFINGHLGEVKLGDLGLSTLKEAERAFTVIGTPEFMAPELYEESYTEAVDVYAFGMCLLEMLTMEYPYMECQNPAQIFRKVFHGEKPKSFYKLKSGDFRNVIGACLEREKNRPTARELLEHPLFRDWATDPGALSNIHLLVDTPLPDGVTEDSFFPSRASTRSASTPGSQSNSVAPSLTLAGAAALTEETRRRYAERANRTTNQTLSDAASVLTQEMTIGVHIPVDNAMKLIEFSFSPASDSVENVTGELVQEFHLDRTYFEKIRAEIEDQIRSSISSKSVRMSPDSSPSTGQGQSAVEQVRSPGQGNGQVYLMRNQNDVGEQGMNGDQHAVVVGKPGVPGNEYIPDQHAHKAQDFGAPSKSNRTDAPSGGISLLFIWYAESDAACGSSFGIDETTTTGISRFSRRLDWAGCVVPKPGDDPIML